MKPKRTIADVVREATLKAIHPNRKQALELIKMGLFNLPDRPRLDYGQCKAYARSTGQRCKAPALPCGVCIRHGALSTGPRTRAGLKATGAAASITLRKKWQQWRAGLGPRPNAPRTRAQLGDA
jgi:hypothetical protein